ALRPSRRRFRWSAFRQARSATPSRVVFGFSTLVASIIETQTSVPLFAGFALTPRRQVRTVENEAGGPHGDTRTGRQAGHEETSAKRRQAHVGRHRGVARLPRDRPPRGRGRRGRGRGRRDLRRPGGGAATRP